MNFANADAPNTSMLASPDGWDVKYGNKYVPDNWESHLAQVASLLESKTVSEKASLYDRNNQTEDKPFIAYNEKISTHLQLILRFPSIIRHTMRFPPSTALCGDGWGRGQIALYPYGPFMTYLAGGNTVSFDDIRRTFTIC